MGNPSLPHKRGARVKYVEACEHGSWHIKLWPDGLGSPPKLIPFQCRSWRHGGPCRQWKGSQDFVRIAEAIGGEKQWAYLVLTFDPKTGGTPFEQYRAGCRCWGVLLKRLQRVYGISKYIQTWERFKKGGVHVNVLVYNEHLIYEVKQDWRAFRKDWLVPNAIAAGFGQRTWVQLIASSAQIAGYLCKLAQEMTGTGKGYQIPVDAPRHFRRIRASRHTLPPIMKSGIPGKLVQAPMPVDSGCKQGTSRIQQ